MKRARRKRSSRRQPWRMRQDIPLDMPALSDDPAMEQARQLLGRETRWETMQELQDDVQAAIDVAEYTHSIGKERREMITAELLDYYQAMVVENLRNEF